MTAPGGGGVNPHDTITAARFAVVIDGVEVAVFSELGGITAEVEPVEYIAANDKEVVQVKLPGKYKPPTVVLKRGKTGDMRLWAWYEAVQFNQISGARKSASLVMYNFEGKPVARYHMFGAWPTKMEIGSLKAGSSEVLLETITIVCDKIQRVSP
ncbi:phage tail protein [Lentzea sp. NEAU-D7]|uniref:phage tail protein n=1 Tax=Lentzea sp. NEAU-D7 TaxID=2994667 RepID=UPI00224B4634|nr:phage tail protein [Lentzea sp. NEAU-D7]MCX2954583.1 phage tail protein [Lentzea sp. NEAU-D7]